MIHGSHTTYNTKGCRCRPCTDAAARYERGRVHRNNHGYSHRVDPIGARRRVEALQFMGWSLDQIAAACGWKDRHNVTKVVGVEHNFILTTTHQTIDAAYRKLSMTPGPSARAKSRAVRMGFVGPLAWEDGEIDNPAAKPYNPKPDRDTVDEVLVQRALDGTKVKANRAEKAEIIRRWVETGKSTNQLIEIQGWNAYRMRKSA